MVYKLWVRVQRGRVFSGNVNLRISVDINIMGNVMLSIYFIIIVLFLDCGTVGSVVTAYKMRSKVNEMSPYEAGRIGEGEGEKKDRVVLDKFYIDILRFVYECVVR